MLHAAAFMNLLKPNFEGQVPLIANQIIWCIHI